MEAALEHCRGNALRAKAEALAFLASAIKALSEDEKEFFSEKSGAFINDGYSVEEADAEALDMAIKMRPSQGVTRRKRIDGLEGLRAFARKEWKWQTGAI